MPSKCVLADFSTRAGSHFTEKETWPWMSSTATTSPVENSVAPSPIHCSP
jgi:hypothetical protein